MDFKLTLRLGNAAMQTGEDVANVLERAATYIADYYAGELEDGAGMSLLDQNGNNVGAWEVSE